MEGTALKQTTLVTACLVSQDSGRICIMIFNPLCCLQALRFLNPGGQHLMAPDGVTRYPDRAIFKIDILIWL